MDYDGNLTRLFRSIGVFQMNTLVSFDEQFLVREKLSSSDPEKYRTAEPIPHCVFDGLICDELLEHVLQEFPGPDGISWRRLENADKASKKMISTEVDQQLGPYTRQLVNLLHSTTMLRFLEKLTGIKGLIPDPHLYAAGLHQIESGGFLEVHSDFSFHPELALHRRVNFLLYLNKDWNEDYHGDLELWDRNMERCVVKYAPTWNRALIHNVTAYAYHGFPEKIQCPSDLTRKSLAVWYYTSNRPENEIAEYQAQSPEFKKRPMSNMNHSENND